MPARRNLTRNCLLPAALDSESAARLLAEHDDYRLEILAASLPEDAGSALRHLLLAAETARVRVWAEAAPFDQKDVLKRRGYRWSDGSDGRARWWWTYVDESALDGEVAFCNTRSTGARCGRERSGSRLTSDISGEVAAVRWPAGMLATSMKRQAFPESGP